MGLPTINELVGKKEQHGADRRLIEPAGLEETGHGGLGNLWDTRRQVNLSQASIGQGNVDLHKEEDSGESAFLAKTGLGPFGSGDLAPNNALLLGQLPPAGGDSAESPANSDLSGGARIVRGKSGVAVLAKPIALPNRTTALARLRNLEDSHNWSKNDCNTPSGGCK
jgi:hypothetical protein